MIPQLNTVTIGHLWRIFDPLIDPLFKIRNELFAELKPILIQVFQTCIRIRFSMHLKMEQNTLWQVIIGFSTWVFSKNESCATFDPLSMSPKTFFAPDLDGLQMYKWIKKERFVKWSDIRASIHSVTVKILMALLELLM